MSASWGEMLWYWNCVKKAKLLDPRNKLYKMGKIKDSVAQDAAYSARESIYEAFWRTMVCGIDAHGNRPTDLSKSFQVYHEAHSSLGHLRDMLDNAELRAQFISFRDLTFIHLSGESFHY